MYLKSGFVAARASATPVEIGSTVEEPETLIVPATAPPLPADAAVLGAAAEAAVLGAAALGAADVPLFEQAPTTNNAARASAERRLGLVMVTR